jgi:hypothetical protein
MALLVVVGFIQNHVSSQVVVRIWTMHPLYADGCPALTLVVMIDEEDGAGQRSGDGRGIRNGSRDGNGSVSNRVECLGTRNRNPNLKPETDPNTDSGENSCSKSNPRITETRLDTRNPLRMATYEE